MISNYLIKFTLVMILAVILYLIIRLAWLKKKKRIVHWNNEWARILFVSYLAALASLTIVPTVNLFNTEIIKQYNFIPLKTLSNQVKYLSYASFINLVGNIVLFIPIGFIAPSIWARFKEWKNVLFLGLLVSGTIEFVQYFIGRIADIDDLIVNTLAIMLGAYIYKRLRAKNLK